MVILTQLAALMVAQADAAGGTASDKFAGLTGLIPFVLMFGVIYFLLMRPASKQRKEHQIMLDALKKDDEVVTSSGMYGRILGLEDKVCTLEIADKVKIRILRDRIAGRWNPSANAPAQK